MSGNPQGGEPGTSGGKAPAAQVPAQVEPKQRGRGAVAAWRMGLVVSASALCGGIAVVLWNRRLLARMREVPEASSPEPYSWEDDG